MNSTVAAALVIAIGISSALRPRSSPRAGRIVHLSEHLHPREYVWAR